MTALAYYCKKLNQSTSDPRINSSLHRKKMVSSDLHRLWAKMGVGGGYFIVALGRWCRGSPTQTLMVWANMPSIFQWPRILRVSMMASKAGQGVSGQGVRLLQGSVPSFQQGGSWAVGLHCLSGACRGAGLWTSSVPGSTHWPLTWEHPLWPRLPPTQPCPGQAAPLWGWQLGRQGSWACEQPRQDLDSSFNHGICLFPSHPPAFSTKKAVEISFWSGTPNSNLFLTAAHCLRLICAHHRLNFSVPWSLTGLLWG